MNDWAQPGVKCVCIDDNRRPISLGAGLPAVEPGGVFPVKGQIYTIASTEWYESPYLSITPSFFGVHLVEINRPRGLMTGSIVPFNIVRFRPLVSTSQEQDVALFAPLLRAATADA